MAAEDNAVVLNPFSQLSKSELEAVALNEAARVFMRRHQEFRPSFSLNEQQKSAFANYGSEQDVRETIAARIVSGDPSALNPTPEQVEFASRLRAALLRGNCRAGLADHIES